MNQSITFHHIDITIYHKKLIEGASLTDNELDCLINAYTHTLMYLGCYGREYLFCYNELSKLLKIVKDLKQNKS